MFQYYIPYSFVGFSYELLSFNRGSSHNPTLFYLLFRLIIMKGSNPNWHQCLYKKKKSIITLPLIPQNN